MLAQISQKIASRLADRKVITEDQIELCAYGFEIGMAMALNVLSTFMIGIFLAMPFEALILLLMYMPIRSFAGGYHAKTHLRCYLLSVLVIAGALLGVKYIPWTNLICFVSALSAGGVIFLLAPVEDSNKPLDETEVKIYKKRTRILLSVLVGITALFVLLKAFNIAACAVMALAILSVMLVLGKVKNNKSLRKE